MKRHAPNKIVIGLTGSLGSGKTTIARILKSKGAKVIDADRIAHSVIRPGSITYKRVVAAFGRGILMKDNVISRTKLGGIVFNDRRLLKKLNNIVHPQVIRSIKNKIKEAGKGVIVLDAPLLIESGLHKITDKLIVVKINRENQIRRLARHRGLNKKQISSRINAQIPLSAKIRLADFIIDNNKGINQTKKRLEFVWGKLTAGRLKSGKIGYQQNEGNEDYRVKQISQGAECQWYNRHKEAGFNL